MLLSFQLIEEFNVFKVFKMMDCKKRELKYL